MWKQRMILLSVLSFSIPGWALVARPLPVDPKGAAAVEKLEAVLGEELSPEQIAQIYELAKDEKPQNFVQVDRSPEKSIYCVGVRAAAVQSHVRAGCIHFGSWKGYEVMLVGFGVSFQLAGSVFKLKITYDPSRYDESFDPVPGRYYAAVVGATALGGFSHLVGSSGNKQISGGSLNIGAGLDYTIAGLLVIE